MFIGCFFDDFLSHFIVKPCENCFRNSFCRAIENFLSKFNKIPSVMLRFFYIYIHSSENCFSISFYNFSAKFIGNFLKKFHNLRIAFIILIKFIHFHEAESKKKIQRTYRLKLLNSKVLKQIRKELPWIFSKILPQKKIQPHNHRIHKEVFKEYIRFAENFHKIIL